MMGIALFSPAFDPFRWIALYFFGLCAAVFILILAFRGKIYLKIEPEGFGTRFPLGRSRFYKWSNVCGIEVRSFPFVGQLKYPNFSLLDILCFYYEKEIGNGKNERSPMKSVTPKLRSLRIAFGESDEKLASILNAWRDKYK